MALEINEIAIQMQVGDSGFEPVEGQSKSEDGSDGEIDYERVVAECVRRVLQAMKSMKER
jgi:hypothetical protein